MTVPNLTKDMHLSAYSISNSTIPKVEGLSFVRDEFFNSTNCKATEYHATYRGEDMDYIFDQVSSILNDDSKFTGDLEFELCSSTNIKKIVTKEGVRTRLSPIYSKIPPKNIYKSGDIHIGINLSKTSASSAEEIERLMLPQFDRLKIIDEEEVIVRICTATFISPSHGAKLFQFLCFWIKTLPDVSVKLKLEMIEKKLRIPEDGPCLPLISDEFIEGWIAENNSEGGFYTPRSCRVLISHS